jgi:hypothetical protein
MALVDFLYRCPYCGLDPLEGKGLTAQCRSCGRGFEPGSGNTAIRVTRPGAPVEEVPAGSLARLMDRLGGATATALNAEGRIVFQSRVRSRFARQETPVRFRKELLGFSEHFGEVEEGWLTLDHDRLLFEPDAADAEAGKSIRTWLLLDLGALQTSSSSVQISPRGGGVVLFRFPDASPRRWEELLKASIRQAWRDAGRGDVVEFQPRILAG